MRTNLMMVPHLTLIIHPSIKTGSNVSSSSNNRFLFTFDRNRLVKFFKELIFLNNNLQICYSFNAPPAKHKNRFLANEVPISFACLLSFAEAAAYKDVPIYLYPLGMSPESNIEEPGKPLNFHDFDNIFGHKLDLKSSQGIIKKMRVVGPATDVSYPTEVKAKKNDEKNLNFIGHVSVRPVSLGAVVDLLAKGSNVMVPSGNDEYVLITLTPQSKWSHKDDFGLSWKVQNDDSASCGAIRVPIVVKSNELFYSKRGTDFMTVFNNELEELSQKTKSSVSSNPFHNEVKEKPAEEVQSDSEYHEVSNAQYEFPKSTTDNQATKTSNVASSKSAPVTESNEEVPNSDADGPLSVRQLSSFLNQFKEEMKEQLVGMVEETVKKFSAKDKAESVSGLKKDAEILINVNDCVKSEADDSDLPKLLSTLSQIEEQLSSIENAANSDMASAKPHKHNMHSYGHGHHRRGRDFSSMTRRATLGVLKKRMKGSVVELEPDLFAISKSGFKLKMARNVSQSFRFVLFKYGKYRNSKFEVDFTPTIVPGGGIECSVKPATKFQDKSLLDDKGGQYTFYDVRFKSKERIGKFRCFLKILRNGKVCGNALCITVRVKRFHSTADPIDSAEEALPCYSGPRGNGFGGFEPTSPANVDVDEGISVFQEYPSSVSSDSEDGEAVNRENDNDEGIDTKLDASCSAFEKLSIKEKGTFSLFDEDSDSSVSLLLDENEVREVVDKDFDSVKIPPCFIPHADMSKEPRSIRIKRKMNSTRKKKSDTPTGSPKSPTRKNDWWELVGGDQPKNTGTNPATDNLHNPYLYHRLRREPLPSQQCPSQVSEERASPRHAKEAKSSDNSSSKTETASKGTYKPIYPTLDELRETSVKTSKKATATKETQSPVAILPEKVFEMTSHVFKSVMNSMKQPNDVKENMQKNIDETLWSISRSVFGGPCPPSAQPSPQPCVVPSAPAEPTVIPTSAASAPNPTLNPLQPVLPADASQIPKQPFSTPPPCLPTFSFPDPQFAPPPGFSPRTNGFPIFPFNIPSQSATVGTNTPNVAPAMNAPCAESVRAPINNSSAEPVVFEGQANVRMPSSAETNLLTTNSAAAPTEIPVTVHTPGNRPQTPETSFSKFSAEALSTSTAASTPAKSPNSSGLIYGEEYNRLEPDVRQKILQLNEMGFMNDNYNLFLIRKYPQDMVKVVESLVNFNDF